MTAFTQLIRAKNDFVHGAPVSPDLIRDAEEALNLHFSEEYRAYLQEFGLAAFAGHELTGISKSPRLNVTDVTTKEKTQNPNIPESYYVVEKANIDGIVIWQAATGEIYQTEYDGAPHLIYKSLAEYIEAV